MASMSGAVRAYDDLVLVFAGCTGRISAEMEFAWLMSDPRSADLQGQRQRFVSVLEAIMPPERARETLSHRVEMKLAHAAILTTANFSDDDRRARLAKQQARIGLQACRALILDG